jgi:hypothetical protein
MMSQRMFLLSSYHKEKGELYSVTLGFEMRLHLGYLDPKGIVVKN